MNPAEKYRSLFKTEPILIESPGRVNLLGEHVDYNGGVVLPAAIDKSIKIAMGISDTETSILYSMDFKEEHSFSKDSPKRSDNGWPNYITGVIDQLNKKGCNIKNFNAIIQGDIPIGAGLSSSAAIECGILFGINELFDLGLDRKAMAQMGQLAEHTFVGTQCGIMDQYANLFGKRNQIIKLDCQSLEHIYLESAFDSHQLLLLDSRVKHSLADTEYNKRKLECDEGSEILSRETGTLGNLRSFNINQLEQIRPVMGETLYKRCKYVIEEMLRVEQATKAITEGSINDLGKLMYQTHEGLNTLYEVSCKELNFLVDLARELKVTGARMMGGGFGGCTLNLVVKERVNEFLRFVKERYNKQFNLDLNTIYVSLEAGTRKVEAFN